MTEDPRDKVARLVREHGIKKKPSEPTAQLAAEGNVSIQNSTVIIGGSNHKVQAQSEAYTRADQRTEQARKKRRAESDNHASYINKRYLEKTRKADSALLKRKADQIEAKEKSKDQQNWLIVFMLVIMCIVAFVIMVEISRVG